MPPHYPVGGSDESPMDGVLPAAPPIFLGYVAAADRNDEDASSGSDEDKAGEFGEPIDAGVLAPPFASPGPQ